MSSTDLPKTIMDGYVDNLIEDEAERALLLAKPTCFIIIGKPVRYIVYTHIETESSPFRNTHITNLLLTSCSKGVGKSTLARKLSQSWKCILVDGKYLIHFVFYTIFPSTLIVFLRHTSLPKICVYHFRHRTTEFTHPGSYRERHRGEQCLCSGQGRFFADILSLMFPDDGSCFSS